MRVTFIHYIFNFIFQIIKVIKFKDLRPLDKKMGQNLVESFTYSGNKFIFDCHFCDEKIKDVLTKFDFAFRIADENLNLLEDSRSANFIYAWKK